ncbi:hypothetical protein D3C83_36130 [compost metagenome]
MAARLPQADDAAGGIVNDRLARETVEIEGWRDDARPQIARADRGLVGAFHAQVGNPAGRSLAVAKSGDVASTLLKGQITAILGQRLRRPVEDRRVEPLRLRNVVRIELGEAERAVRMCHRTADS